jgi:hypothetical protein
MVRLIGGAPPRRQHTEKRDHRADRRAEPAVQPGGRHDQQRVEVTEPVPGRVEPVVLAVAGAAGQLGAAVHDQLAHVVEIDSQLTARHAWMVAALCNDEITIG